MVLFFAATLCNDYLQQQSRAATTSITSASLRQRFLQLLGLYQPNEQHLSAITLRHRLKVVAAAFVALLLVSQISQWYLDGSGHALLLASMGVSAVLLFGLPGSPLAKPAVFL